MSSLADFDRELNAILGPELTAVSRPDQITHRQLARIESQARRREMPRTHPNMNFHGPSQVAVGHSEVSAKEFDLLRQYVVDVTEVMTQRMDRLEDDLRWARSVACLASGFALLSFGVLLGVALT